MILEKISYGNDFELQEVKLFLKNNDLNFDVTCDYTIVLRDENEIILGTASKTKNILKCFAIDLSVRGLGISGQLITNITNKMFEEGFTSSFVFTKTENEDLFLGMGYKKIVNTDKVSLLEIGTENIEKILNKIKSDYSLEEKKERAMLIMNCNPFTLGHKYLIEKAALENEEVLVFVVEEDSSVFSFKTRIELVRKGCANMGNVKIIKGTQYLISQLTFPNYFLKQDDDSLLEYTKLDVMIAGKIICPKFNIKKRYIGEEPFCPMTSKYNETIKELFPKFGIEVIVVKRKEQNNKAISATEVRKALALEEIEKIKKLVPETTFEFLISSQGKKIGEKIKKIFGDGKVENQ
ncbi:MAG: [citrate (pro-3S)-lyase] ligase [Fusobacteriaceae bacterium]